MTISFELVETSALIPYPGNSRVHSGDQIDALIKSINLYGFISPLVCDEEYRVLAGHGRLTAARQIPIERVPCIVKKGLSDEEKAAYTIADNRLSDLSEFNDEILRNEIESLASSDFDIDSLFFDKKTLSTLFDETALVDVESENDFDVVNITVSIDYSKYEQLIADINQLIADKYATAKVALVE